MQLPLIHACCQQWGLSLMELVQAVWTATLHAYSGTEDVMFAGIGMKRRSLKQQWIDTSVYRAHLEQDSPVISVLDHTEDGGLLEADSLVSVPEALEVLSTLDPKPCNTAIWLKDPLGKAKLSENDIVNGHTVSEISIDIFV